MKPSLQTFGRCSLNHPGRVAVDGSRIYWAEGSTA
jgi:hypothetical protein